MKVNDRFMMGRHRLYPILITIICLFFVSAFSRSQPNCSTEVRVNDSSAKVFIDGVPTQSPPVRIICKESPQLITVAVADGQVLTRKMPGAEQFSKADREWNIFFLPQDSTSAHADTIATHFVQAAGSGANDARILDELIEIRRLIEKLAITNPEVKKTLGKVMKKISSERKVAATEPVAKSQKAPASVAVPLGSTLWTGPYVQLHSLARPNFQTSVVKEDLDSQVKGVSGQLLKFCNWKKDESSPNWTRVMIGPFENLSQARNFALLFGHESFAVNGLLCKNPAAKEMQL